MLSCKYHTYWAFYRYILTVNPSDFKQLGLATWTLSSALP